MPPVTESKVRKYISNSGLVIGGGIMAKNPQVESVQFMTVAEVQQILQDPYFDTFSADEQVVYVTLSGNFSVEGEENWRSAFKVFSVETGNELMGGAR